MSRRIRPVTKLLLTLCAAFCFAGTAAADDLPSSLQFFYRAANSPTVNPVSPFGTVVFPDTAIGKTSSITFLIQTSQNSNNVYTIKNLAVSGPGFSLGPQSGTVPAAGGQGSVVINFSPTAGDFANGTLQFTLNSPSGLNFDYSFTLFGRVISPRVVTSYTLSSTNNQTVIQPGDTLLFPSTPVNGSSQATFVIANTGTGPATVDSVALSGDAFKLGNLSLVPATLNGGNEFRFTITFNPLAAKRYTGTLSVSVGGKPSTYTLDGQGTAAAFTYQTINGSTAAPLTPGASIAFPDTAADGVAKSTVTIQVTNSGNADGTLANINLTGSDFQLANLPALPKVLGGNPSAFGQISATFFDVVYMPAKPGPSTGRLQVGNDIFTLTGNGQGAVLTVTADVGTGAIAVPNKGTISIPNTAVGTRRSVFVTVTNTGNLPATISSFSATGPVFTTPSTPALPIALAPGASQRFELRFAPVAVGAVTATLAINEQVFTLIGAGDPPAALPTVTISGVGAQTDPLQQPAATVQIATPYPADLRGVLTLAFLSDSFSDDPAIQFANGTRTVNFTIPAGTTQAVFDQLGRTAPFQTGTVSGRIVLSTSFTVGQVDLTPATAPSLSTMIPAGPPQLTSVRLGNQNGNTFQLLVSGYSTSRSVTQLALQFTGAAGTNLQTSQQTVDVASAFTNFYLDPGSRVFGSQFTLTLTLTINGDPNALQSVSVTVSNSRGTSAARSVALR